MSTGIQEEIQKSRNSMSVGISDGKQKNREVIKLHKGKPHLRTEVVFLTPINEEDAYKFRTLLMNGELQKFISDAINKVELDIGETFEADIESVYLSVKNTL